MCFAGGIETGGDAVVFVSVALGDAGSFNGPGTLGGTVTFKLAAGGPIR
jgi:hypothetical protein